MAWFQVLLLLLQHAQGQQQAVMHKIIGIECGEVTLGSNLVDWVQELAGLQEGPCDSSGFSEATGTKELELPILGKLSFGIFRKPDVLGLAVQLSQQLGGQPATRGEACCQTCKEDEEKYVRVDSGSCQEACLSVGKQLMVSMAGLMDGFSRSKPCSALGFPMFNVTLTKGVEPAGFSWDVYVPQPPHTETLRKVAAGICGEVTVSDETQLAPLKQWGLLEEGGCVSAGYSTTMGKQEIPGFQQQMSLFRKAEDLDIVEAVHMLFAALAQDTTVLYKVVGDLCSQATVDRKFVEPLEVLDFGRGSCEDQGFTKPSGSQSFSVLLTDVQLALYRKEGALGLHI